MSHMGPNDPKNYSAKFAVVLDLFTQFHENQNNAKIEKCYKQPSYLQNGEIKT